MFAHQHEDLRPDVMTLAKALGNGVPIGACLARGRAAEMFGPGSHGSTFGGNPLACRVGLSVLEILERERMADRAAQLGGHLLGGFREALADTQGVVDIRGRGLMIGIELDRPCAELVGQALAAGLLINVTADRVVRLLPPLILSDAQADHLVGTLSDLIAFLPVESLNPASAVREEYPVMQRIQSAPTFSDPAGPQQPTSSAPSCDAPSS